VAMNMVTTVALESYAKECCDLGPTSWQRKVWHRIVLKGEELMLGCSLAEIGPEEVLQSTTSQLLGGVLPLKVSLRYASGLAEAEPLGLCTVKLMMVRDRIAVCW
jgi:hypothetical protein